MQKYAKFTTIVSTALFPLLILFLVFNTLFIDCGFYERHNADRQSCQNFLNYVYTGELKQSFGEQEDDHLNDVKKIYWTWLLVMGIALWVWLFAFLYSDKRKSVLYGSLLLFVILGIAVVIPFATSFTSFHNVFFPQGNWMFPADSLLIKAFPIEFFQAFVTALLIRSFLAGILCFIAVILRYTNV